MRAAIAALLIFLFIAVVTGTITYPTRDEAVLLLSSLSLLFLSWMYTREKRSLKEPENEAKKDK